jgi:hypothetical protein
MLTNLYEPLFHTLMLTVTNTAVMQNFKIILSKFNVVGIFSSGYYAWECITKLCNH